MSNYVMLECGELPRSVGVYNNVFPKEYPAYYSMCFRIQMLVITVLVIGCQAFKIYMDVQKEELSQATIIISAVATVIYFLLVMLIFWWWCPSKVVRTNDEVIVSFKGARDQRIPLDDLVEVRCIHMMSCTDMASMCSKYFGRKIFWGVATGWMKRLIIVTNSCCNNYQVSMTDHVMEEFLRDNSRQMPIAC